MAVIEMLASHAHAEDARGYWSDKIGGALQVIVQFDKHTSGPWDATIPVPAQNLESKVEDVGVTRDRIAFALPRFKASYQAMWNEQTQTWTGTWTQGRTVLRDNPRAVVKEMPGLNHPFQTARDDAPAEYGEIEETMAPIALDTTGSWIAATVG